MLFKGVKKPNPEKEKKLREDLEEYGGLEKKDLPALIISAFLVILPVAIAVLLLFVLAAWLFL